MGKNRTKSNQKECVWEQSGDISFWMLEGKGQHSVGVGWLLVQQAEDKAAQAGVLVVLVK